MVPEGGRWIDTIDGVAGPVLTGLYAQPLTASLLLAERVWVQCEKGVPACVGEAPCGVAYSPLPSTATGPSEAIRPPSEASQVLLLKSLKETVPPACAPNRPLSLAVSLKVAPTVPEAGSWTVSTDGLAGPILTGSSAQPETASLLLASPE